ncbi:uncharacterized protein SCHCODRAFT_02546243 [Schizophyllum commune H4-8]|nr:uncharacterized protein SCHCODRAFT_02546243 [Schizophyllum commune H4-8]KAI5890096.1 hypothetical protein SCHCODRAFT_02546243 [Schizophyllum commune H4-8]
MLERIFLIQHGVPVIARPLAEPGANTSVRLAFADTAHVLHVCAMAVARVVRVLARFTQAMLEAVTAVDTEVEPHGLKLSGLYDTFMERLENLLKSIDRSNEALVRLDGLITQTLSYPPVFNYVFLRHIIPFIMRHNAIRLSSRAIIMTAGRPTLANIRLTVLEIADMAHRLRNHASDGRAHFSLDGLVEIWGLSQDKRSKLCDALNTIVFDLDGSGCFAFVGTVDEALRFARESRACILFAAMQLSALTRDPMLLMTFKEIVSYSHCFIQKSVIILGHLAAFIRAIHCSIYNTDTDQFGPCVDRANDAYAALRYELADLFHGAHAAESVQAFDNFLRSRLSISPPLVRAVSKRTVSPVLKICKRVLPLHRTKLTKLRDTLAEMRGSVFATGRLIANLQVEVPDLLSPKGGFIGDLERKLDAGDWVYLVGLMQFFQEKYLDVKDALDDLKDIADEIGQVVMGY